MVRKSGALFLLEKADEHTAQKAQINNQFDCCFNRFPCWVHQSKTINELFS